VCVCVRVGGWVGGWAYVCSFDGEDRRTVLHIFPLLSVVSSHARNERRFFLSVLYIFYYRTIHTPSASMANSVSLYRAIVLFPVFWHFDDSGSHVTTLAGSLFSLLSTFCAPLIVTPAVVAM
jgi:hypothetical protein